MAHCFLSKTVDFSQRKQSKAIMPFTSQKHYPSLTFYLLITKSTHALARELQLHILDGRVLKKFANIFYLYLHSFCFGTKAHWCLWATSVSVLRHSWWGSGAIPCWGLNLGLSFAKHMLLLFESSPWSCKHFLILFSIVGSHLEVLRATQFGAWWITKSYDQTLPTPCKVELFLWPFKII